VLAAYLVITNNNRQSQSERKATSMAIREVSVQGKKRNNDQ